MSIDVQKMINEVATRNKCRVEEGDPIFAVSTVNELMLDEVVQGLLTRARVVRAEFEESARKVESHAREKLAEEFRVSTAAWKAEVAQDLNIANARCCEMIDRIHRAHSKPARQRWTAVGLLAGLILYGCGYFARDIYRIEAPASATHDLKSPDPAVSKATSGSDKHGRNAAQDKHSGPPTRVNRRPQD
jgi:hypothetical protein